MPLSLQERAIFKNFFTENKIRYHDGFRNFTRNIYKPDALVINIDFPEQIRALIKMLNEYNKSRSVKKLITLRAAAGGKGTQYSGSFSMTPCMEADIVMHLSGDFFQKIHVLDNKTHLVRVGAGVQIDQLEEELNKLKLSLPTSSMLRYATLVGLLTNAGHGTGIAQPAVSGLVQSMIIARPDGEIVEFKKGDPDFDAICGCNLGLFGIIVSVDILCIPQKKLQCIQQVKSMKQLIEDIENGLFYQHDYVSIMYVPTYQVDEEKQENILVLLWKPVDDELPLSHDHACLSHFGQRLEISINNAFEIPNFLTRHKQLIPNYMKSFVAPAAVGHTNSTKIGTWREVAHYVTAFPWQIDDTDLLFPTQRETKNQNVIEALKKLNAMLASYQQHAQYPVIDGIYLRVFGGTNSPLSTSSHQPGEEICGIDIVSAPNIPGFQAFKKEFIEYGITKLNARPHWGKSVPEFVDLEQVYGEKIIQFRTILKNWFQQVAIDPQYSFLFNDFARRIAGMERTLQPAAVKEESKAATPEYITAQQLLTHLDEKQMTNDHAEQLRTELNRIVISSQPGRHHSSNKMLMYAVDEEISYNALQSEEHKDNIEKPAKRKCCTIL